MEGRAGPRGGCQGGRPGAPSDITRRNNVNLTRQLCEFLASMDARRIGEANMLDIRYKLLDWLGCCIAASDRHCAVELRGVLREQGGSGMCSAVGVEGKTSSHEAAFYNGVISHALEYDDTNKIAITHPGAPVMAAALAAAEATGATLETFSCGVAAGYEAMIRLGGAVNPDHYEYWHTTGTCGTFAAAAAAARIMGLDAARTEAAMGIAATMASGLICVFGTEAKLVTVGNAARNGLLAAELASRGFSAPEDAFASPKGYARAARGKDDLSFMAPRPGDSLLIEDAYYKMHASCGHTHSALDALQAIIAESGVKAEDVERVEVLAYRTAVELCAKYQTETETKAKFSMPFCVANMLMNGRVTLSEFDEAHLTSAAIRDYARRVTVREEPSFTRDYPGLRKEKVILTLRDGTVLEKQVDLPVGRPPYAFIEDKYFSLAQTVITREKSAAIRDLLMNMNESDTLAALGEAVRSLQ